MVKAILTKEISIDTPNGVGIAAKVAQLVSGQAKANIRAAWASGVNGSGHFSLITDANQKVMDALKGEFPKLKEQDVLVFDVKNALGDIAMVTEQLSKANLNINYLYTTYVDEKPALILSTDDNKKALGLFSH